MDVSKRYNELIRQIYKEQIMDAMHGEDIKPYSYQKDAGSRPATPTSRNGSELDAHINSALDVLINQLNILQETLKYVLQPEAEGDPASDSSSQPMVPKSPYVEDQLLVLRRIHGITYRIGMLITRVQYSE